MPLAEAQNPLKPKSTPKNLISAGLGLRAWILQPDSSDSRTLRPTILGPSLGVGFEVHQQPLNKKGALFLQATRF